MMGKKNNQKISSGNDSTNFAIGGDFNVNFNVEVPTELVAKIVKQEVEKLRKSRFYPEYDRVNISLRLVRRLTEGDLQRCLDEVKGWALAWCARLIAYSEEFKQVDGILKIVKTLGDFPEAKIAEAFLISQKGDKTLALQTLAAIESHASRSAGLMITAHHDGAENALKWMIDTGYTPEFLDADGKNFLLILQLQMGYWGNAAQTVEDLSESDFAEAPILHHLAALTKLATAVPVEFRAAILAQVPFSVKSFPLASNAAAMDARRTAHHHFIAAYEVAEQLACPLAAKLEDEYALWLELRDPAQSMEGKTRLIGKLRDATTSLGFVHYALQFGIKLDQSAVEQDIERSIAINGGMTTDAAIARFALAFTQQSPVEAANYIARHYNQLAAHIDTSLMRYRQIELLSRAGLNRKAKEVLSQLLKEGISAELESTLQRIISEGQGNDPIESRKAQYEATKALSDLINLVTELEVHERWDELCEFGRLLFDETHSLSDAERLVKAFNNTHRVEALVDFLKGNIDLLDQSKQLHMSYAWGLYYNGDLLESRAVLAALRDDVGSQNYRALQVNLGIATGDWAVLSSYIDVEYQHRDNRSAHDLIVAAQLALYVGSPLAKNLVFEAAAKASDDPAVLVAAYFIATRAGWEDDPKVFQWLEKAAELSGDDGPLHRFNLKDIIDQKLDWDRHESETWRLLTQGQIPIFLAAQSLNRTLIDLITFPALANLSEIDPRRRSAIPAYSGKRVPLKFDTSVKVVALDVTALLTLGFLNILDVVLDTFETVYIPHSTLEWLFKESQKAIFHQPSRIVDAHKIRGFFATGVLDKFVSSAAASSELSTQVGDELAALIAEAEKIREDDDMQHIVIRPAPVHRLSSLMEEEADLSPHTAVLSSCLAVVKKLRQKGQITAKEEKRARAYLQLHEKPWPNQPDIADRATLYLDDLAVTYFLHLGIIEKLKAAGHRVIVSPRKISETNALIAYESISDDVKGIIDNIRCSLNLRIESGKVRVNHIHSFDEPGEKSILEHPSSGLFALASNCDIAIIDDRFINQHANIESNAVQMPVFSTLDLLSNLVISGVLSEDDYIEHMTRLRRASYLFVPISAGELERCLLASAIVDGSLVETVELKAIRESILHARMSNWLQLPEEMPWLDDMLRTFICVLRKLWSDGADVEEVIARSNWLFDQIDVRGWAHSFIPENADSVWQIRHIIHTRFLPMLLHVVGKNTMDAYYNWLEKRILIPLQEQFPEAYERLINWSRDYVIKMGESFLLEDDNS